MDRVVVQLGSQGISRTRRRQLLAEMRQIQVAHARIGAPRAQLRALLLALTEPPSRVPQALRRRLRDWLL